MWAFCSVRSTVPQPANAPNAVRIRMYGVRFRTLDFFARHGPASLAMKCLDVTEREGRYNARLIEVEEPRFKQGETLVRVAASGVNRADLSQIAGKYPPPPGESEILGLEVSGTLVDGGKEVCAILAGGGHA